MTTPKAPLLEAARWRIGLPFENHFARDDCQGGAITKPGCMKKGLGYLGYDCSGLVIASACDVLGINVIAWPPALRHAKQLASLATEGSLWREGDIFLTYPPEPITSSLDRMHIGVCSEGGRVVHATPPSGVREGEHIPSNCRLEIVSFESLVELIVQTSALSE